MKLDHIGLAVPTLAEGLKLYRDGLGAPVVAEEVVESQGVKVAKVDVGNTIVELLEPITEGEGPIGKYLTKNGPGIHHICFKVDDVRAKATELVALGYRALSAEPVPGAEGKLVLFLHPKSTLGTLIELSQDPPGDAQPH